MQRYYLWTLMLLALGVLPSAGQSQDAAEGQGLRVTPARLELHSPESSEQLLVYGGDPTVAATDLTHAATYSTDPPEIVEVSSSGRVIPLRPGEAQIHVQSGTQRATLRVRVGPIDTPPPISYRRDVIPILSKAGCNAGGCHGKAEGQNGFKLSVFGYDALADHQALVHEARGRRVSPAAPDQSLLLLKATARLPHGGGLKVEPDSRWYRVLRRWITEGLTLDGEVEDPVVSIKVEPAEVVLSARGSQQLRVVARTRSGIARCVTVEAEYQSNADAIAGVDRDGRITATEVPGEAAILVRYLGHVAVSRVTRPRAAASFARPAAANFVDDLVWNKLERLRVPPSPRADDATFLRRVYLDTIGTLPTADEARAFLADANPDKRTRLIDALLERPEYADYWALRWADLLQVDKDTIQPQGAVAMTRWIHAQIEANVPYDEFVYSILTAQGSTFRESPAAFFQVQNDPEKVARSVSQLFLGVRIECAQCHHHPFERWDQQDYYALAAYFTGVARREGPAGSQKIVDQPGSDLQHPRTGQLVTAAGLGAPPATFDDPLARRRDFARWATAADNPYFTRTIVNRIWAHYFGRGLVEPVDDLRATNPAANEPLLAALAAHLVELKFDMKAFTRTLLESNAYQLSCEMIDGNELDEQNYSHAAWKPLPAEVLLDAISQATGVAEQFNGWPAGYRAIQVWDNKLPSHFFEVFGRPQRQTVCACERGVEPSIAQALHLMNSATTVAKIQDPRGMAARLAASALSADEIIDELYLSTLSRYPSDAERQLMRSVCDESGARNAAVEDMLWVLLNNKEFVFNH